MKKIIGCLTLIIALALSVFSFSACSQENEGRISVVTVNFPCYDLARAVNGGTDGLTMLIKPGGEVHSYDPTPRDISKISKCDIFIYIGGENDAWVERILGEKKNENRIVIRLMDSVTLLEETDDGIAGSESHDNDNEIENDEHIWTSPVNYLKMLTVVSDAFVSADAEFSDTYAQNTQDYRKKIEKLDVDFTSLFDGFSGKVVVADRFPFLYLFKEYSVSYMAAASGCDTSGDIPAKTLSSLINFVKENKIKCVYYIEFSSQSVANIIAESASCQTALLHSCHNVTADDFNAGKTYVDIMTANIDSLKKAVQG